MKPIKYNNYNYNFDRIGGIMFHLTECCATWLINLLHILANLG